MNEIEKKQLGVYRTRTELSQVLNRVAYGKEVIVVTSHGKPKAAIVSLDLLEEMEDALAAVEALKEYEAGETKS